MVIPDDVPFHLASLIGCAVMTGVGAAINTAQVTPGLVRGGLRLWRRRNQRHPGGSHRRRGEIVAVDLVDTKLEAALGFGATHAVLPDGVADLVASLTGGDGFDFAFEAIGKLHHHAHGVRRDPPGRYHLRHRLGAHRPDGPVLGLRTLLRGEAAHRLVLRLRQCEDRLPPPLAPLAHRALDLEGMVTRRITIDEVQEAFGAMERGEVIRTVIEFD